MNTSFDGSPRVLEVTGLRKDFGSVSAVKAVSFAVERGETLCLLGPNGAGKTTTIEICEGFTRPTAGEVSVLGFNPTQQPDAVRERIGIMLQGGGSYSGIRVREMLQLTASYKANPLDPDWLLDLLGLQAVANRTYRRLSGGQQQRLSLALALVGRPELIFLDEPTAGMDAQSRLAVWEIISALKRDGVSLVLTTHLMDEAEALADRVVIIDHGANVAAGTPAELSRSLPGGLVTFSTNAPVDLEALASAGLHAHVQRPLHYQLEQGQPVTADNSATAASPATATTDTPELIARLTTELARQNVLVRTINTASATLEDVFLHLTGKELRS